MSLLTKHTNKFNQTINGVVNNKTTGASGVDAILQNFLNNDNYIYDIIHFGTVANADLLDGIDSTQFLRSDENAIFTSLTAKSNRYWKNGVFALNLENSDVIGVNNLYFKDVSDAHEGLRFLKTGKLADSKNDDDYTTFRIDGEGKAFIDTAKIWTNLNHGAGSGLSADNVGGIYSGQIITNVGTTGQHMRSNLGVDTTVKPTISLAVGEANTGIDFVGTNVFRTMNGGSEGVRFNQFNTEFKKHVQMNTTLNVNGKATVSSVKTPIIELSDTVTMSLPNINTANLSGVTNLQVSGSNVLTKANTGHGIGGDVDTVDGIHGHQFVRNDSTSNQHIKGKLILGNTTASPTIDLAIGDSDTGLKHISDGNVQMMANGINIGQFSNVGMNWTKVPKVNSVNILLSNGKAADSNLLDGKNSTAFLELSKGGAVSGTLSLNGSTVLTTANTGSGKGLDVDKLDGAHLSQLVRNDITSAQKVKGKIGIDTLSTPAISLAIGDSDTGLHKIADGRCAMYANGVNIGDWTSNGMDWNKTPKVNGVNVLLINGKAADSQKVDGLDGSQLLRSDTSGTVHGNLAVTGGLTVGGWTFSVVS